MKRMKKTTNPPELAAHQERIWTYWIEKALPRRKRQQERKQQEREQRKQEKKKETN